MQLNYFKKTEVFSISEQIEPHPYKMLIEKNLTIKPLFGKIFLNFKAKLKNIFLNGAIILSTISQLLYIFKNPEPYIIERRPNIDTYEDYIAALEYSKVYAK